MVSSGVLGRANDCSFLRLATSRLDGVEVGAVGQEEQHLVPLRGGDGLRACFLWNEA